MKKSSESPVSFWNDFRFLCRNAWKKITHQWGWKVVSLLLAVLLWGILTSQNTALLREKTFEDVPVSIVNANLLRENRLIVTSGLDDTLTVQIKAEIPQGNYETATVDEYVVLADLSQITGTGLQTVPLSAAALTPAAYGNVIEIIPSFITVRAEQLLTRTRIPVQIRTTGELSGSLYAGTATCDPATVDIVGPLTLTLNIARCVVINDLSALPDTPETVLTSTPFFFEDRSGNRVESSELTVSTQSITIEDINIEQKLYSLAEIPVPVEQLYTGTPADGYRVANVTVTPSTIQLAADNAADYASGKTALPLNGKIDITGNSTSKTASISIQTRDLAWVSERTLSVTIDIEPVNNQEPLP